MIPPSLDAQIQAIAKATADKIAAEFFSTKDANIIASALHEVASLVAQAQREQDAPFMQHKPMCDVIERRLVFGGTIGLVEPRCDCGFAAAIRASDTETPREPA